MQEKYSTRSPVAIRYNVCLGNKLLEDCQGILSQQCLIRATTLSSTAQQRLPRGTLRIVPTMVVTSNTNTSWKAKNQSLVNEARAALAVTRTAKIKRSGSNDFRGIENQQIPTDAIYGTKAKACTLDKGQQLQWVDSELNKPMPPTIQSIFSPPMSGLQLQLCPRPSLSKFSTGKSYLPKTLLIIKIIMLSKTYMWIGEALDSWGSLTSSCDSSSFPVSDSKNGDMVGEMKQVKTQWMKPKKHQINQACCSHLVPYLKTT